MHSIETKSPEERCIVMRWLRLGKDSRGVGKMIYAESSSIIPQLCNAGWEKTYLYCFYQKALNFKLACSKFSGYNTPFAVRTNKGVLPHVLVRMLSKTSRLMASKLIAGAKPLYDGRGGVLVTT